MKESKEDRFCRVAEARVNKIIKMMRLLGNCSNNAVYAFSPEQGDQIFETLQFELKQARKQYIQTTKKRFSLSDDSADHSYPSLELLLPDGTSLTAKAIDDENFPAINIYRDGAECESHEEVAFVEYNPERSPCHKVCIGAYQSDRDDTTYYQPYMAERNTDEL